jgi:hypothetical protein
VPYIVNQCSVLLTHGFSFSPNLLFFFPFTYFYFLWLSSCELATMTLVFMTGRFWTRVWISQLYSFFSFHLRCF